MIKKNFKNQFMILAGSAFYQMWLGQENLLFHEIKWDGIASFRGIHVRFVSFNCNLLATFSLFSITFLLSPANLFLHLSIVYDNCTLPECTSASWSNALFGILQNLLLNSWNSYIENQNRREIQVNCDN